MGTETSDIIDILSGIEPGSSLDGIRARRLQARQNAQKSYVALFEPVDFGDVAAAERYAVAAFVAGIQDEPPAAGFYFGRLAKAADRLAWVDTLKAEIERARTEGPYGAFPAGPPPWRWSSWRPRSNARRSAFRPLRSCVPSCRTRCSPRPPTSVPSPAT